MSIYLASIFFVQISIAIPSTTTIQSVWQDDYTYSQFQWTVSPMIPGGATITDVDGFDWHGPYNQNYVISRQFYCEQLSSVSVSYYANACGTLDPIDKIILYLNNIQQCSLTADADLGKDRRLQSVSTCSGNWHALGTIQPDEGVSHTMSSPDEPFDVRFEIYVQNTNDYLAMNDIQINCTAEIPSTTHEIPSTTAETTTTSTAAEDTTSTTTTSTAPTTITAAPTTTTTSTAPTTTTAAPTTTTTSLAPTTTTVPPTTTTSSTSTTTTAPTTTTTTTAPTTTTSTASTAATTTTTNTPETTTSTSVAPTTTSTSTTGATTTATSSTSVTESTSSTSTSTTKREDNEGRVEDDTQATEADTDADGDIKSGSQQIGGSKVDIKGGDTLYVIIGCVVGAILCLASCVVIRMRMNKAIAKELEENMKKSVEDAKAMHFVSVSDELKQQKQQRANDEVRLEIVGSDKQPIPSPNSSNSFHDLAEVYSQSLPSPNIGSLSNNPALFGAELGNLNAVNDALMDDVIEDMDEGGLIEGDHDTKGGLEGGYVTRGGPDDDGEDIIAGPQTAGFDEDEDKDEENVPPPPLPPQPLNDNKDDNVIAAPETTAGYATSARSLAVFVDHDEAPAPPIPPVPDDDDEEYEYYEEEQVMAAPETTGGGPIATEQDEYEYYEEEEDVPAPPV